MKFFLKSKASFRPLQGLPIINHSMCRFNGVKRTVFPSPTGVTYYKSQLAQLSGVNLRMIRFRPLQGLPIINNIKLN